MIASRRASLQQIAAPSAEHAGLWLDRFLPALPQREERVERSPQAEHIATASAIREPAIYRPAFERWQRELAAAGAAIRTGAVEGRVVVGLGAESVLETAITLHRAYGVPYIPGTALKGTAAAYARRFLDGPWARGGEAYKVVFGEGEHTGQAGYITFFDALYVPGSSRQGPLQPDVLTVHHADYYMGGATPKPPADWDSPNPVAFMSATGEYLLALAGPSERWVERTFELLAVALAEIGVGAKTASGYGRMAVLPYRGPGAPAAAERVARPASSVAATAEPAVEPAPKQPAARSAPVTREVGDVFVGRIVQMDASAAVIEVPGFTREQMIALMPAEAADLRRYRVGNSARVEVTDRRTLKSGVVRLMVRPAPKGEG